MSGAKLGAPSAASEQPQVDGKNFEEKVLLQFPSYHRLRKKVPTCDDLLNGHYFLLHNLFYFMNINFFKVLRSSSSIIHVVAFRKS
jgi:hypothetical protein